MTDNNKFDGDLKAGDFDCDDVNSGDVSQDGNLQTTQSGDDLSGQQQDGQRAFKNIPRETILEFVEADGKLLLRDAKNTADWLVAIEFSDKIKDLIGDDHLFLGEHMITAAITMFMRQQKARWHANVYDVEPSFYS